MTPERHEQIGELFDVALKLEPSRRRMFLDQACAHDPQLRQEIESLIASHENAGEFITAPALEVAAKAAAMDTNQPKTVGPYEILSLIGAGGMGDVYLARDTRLGREVALKFLPEEFQHDSDRRARLLTEAQAASLLHSSSIAHIYDIGNEQDRHYIVMEYVEGQLLSARLESGALGFEEAIDIGMQVAEALDEAHAKGIIHRDIKSSNLMITARSQVKVLDFGLAKMTHRPSLERDETAPGQIMGTVHYMSPEQARGLRVDGRSDIFSLGVVLYEMVTARRPFDGPTASDVLSAILEREPESVSRHTPDVPTGLAQVIGKCLAKDPQRRYATAADLMRELESVRNEDAARGIRRMPRFGIAAALIVLAAIVAVTVGMFIRTREPALTERDSIVLADFVNTTGDPAFDGTLKQALAIQLEQSPYLNIVEEDRIRDTLRYMGRSPDERITRDVAREICERENVKGMLVGSIAPLGRQYVVDLDAVHCGTGESLGREQEQADSKEAVLKALGQAASSLRAKLGESLVSIQKFDVPIERATTSSLEALRAYSLSNDRFLHGDNRQAITFASRAIELDPGFASAYRLLSSLYGNLSSPELSRRYSKEAFARRERASEPERLAISGTYYSSVTGEVDKAIEIYELWKQLFPREAAPRNSLAVQLYRSGRFDRVPAEFQEVIRLRPDVSVYRANLGTAFLALNRVAEAKAAFNEAVEKKLDTSFNFHANVAFWIAFLERDQQAMQREINWARGKVQEYQMRFNEAQAAAVEGRLKKAVRLDEAAIGMVRQTGLLETAATYTAQEALMQAMVGNFPEAKRRAADAIALSKSERVLASAGHALAIAGSSEAGRIVAQLEEEFPTFTLVQAVFSPTIRSTLELQRKNATRAVVLLNAATPYERGFPTAIYARGQAYLQLQAAAEAATEFQKIIDQRGTLAPATPLYALSVLYPLAHVGLARARALGGDAAGARKAYEDFFAIWKDADPDIPILVQARQEYSKLN